MRIGGGAAKGLQVAAIKLLASQTNTPKYYTTVLNKQARKETNKETNKEKQTSKQTNIQQ